MVYAVDFDYPGLWVTLLRPLQLGEEFSVKKDPTTHEWRLLLAVVDAGREGSFTPQRFVSHDKDSHGSYGTYLLPRYTCWDSELGTASVYTVFSLIDPNAGTVHLARIDLTCAL